MDPMRMLSEAWEGKIPPPDFGGGRTDRKMVTSMGRNSIKDVNF